MNADEREALLTLASGEKDFWSEWIREYRQLVMAGLAACRVDGMRGEWIRLTNQGRAAL